MAKEGNEKKDKFVSIPILFFHFRCGHDTRNKLGTRLIAAKNAPFKGLLRKMGNKLSCSCGPLKIKGYRLDGQERSCQMAIAVDF